MCTTVMSITYVNNCSVINCFVNNCRVVLWRLQESTAEGSWVGSPYHKWPIIQTPWPKHPPLRWLWMAWRDERPRHELTRQTFSYEMWFLVHTFCCPGSTSVLNSHDLQKCKRTIISQLKGGERDSISWSKSWFIVCWNICLLCRLV